MRLVERARCFVAVPGQPDFRLCFGKRRGGWPNPMTSMAVEVSGLRGAACFAGPGAQNANRLQGIERFGAMFRR